jgi:hypothetical protein
MEMKMTYVELEAEGLIRKTRMDPKRVTDSLELARRDIETARSVLDHSHDWAYNIAYNAMLQSSRALMFSLGQPRQYVPLPQVPGDVLPAALSQHGLATIPTQGKSIKRPHIHFKA